MLQGDFLLFGPLLLGIGSFGFFCHRNLVEGESCVFGLNVRVSWRWSVLITQRTQPLPHLFLNLRLIALSHLFLSVSPRQILSSVTIDSLIGDLPFNDNMSTKSTYKGAPPKYVPLGDPSRFYPRSSF
jgi:hypothetical protein